MSNTIDYYNKNADAFAKDTQLLDFRVTQEKFLSYLKEGDLILDFGCGAGRDTKYFLDHGYRVEAMDGSEALCKIASRYTGIEVKQKYFEELDENKKYDGIWACSSILHLPYDALVEVLKKMQKALKPSGVIYTSFKYGDFTGERHGRYFTNLTEASFASLLSQVGGLTVIEEWITGDVRHDREDERWLNVLLRRSQS
jgi:2-polyprenyl-3-methyl-5-hydroxy-6-metoxy-1,4-benzoquinol methylase